MRSVIADFLAPIGLRLSEAKTKVVHLADGFDFLGYRIQRRRKRGTSKHHVYLYSSKNALTRGKHKIRGSDVPEGAPRPEDTTAADQPGPTRLGSLLQVRQLQRNFRLPQPLHMVAGGP